MAVDAAAEVVIQREFDDLLKSLTLSGEPKDVDLVRRAFELAKEAHGQVVRRSGEPYILHPIAVAKIVSRLIPGDTESVVCALLHDVVEDTPYTVEDIKERFSPTVANIVDGLTKMEELAQEGETLQVVNFQKLLLTIEDDVRTIIIKLADRLHNMRTLDSMPPDKQRKIASETTYFYAPIANRLGLYNIKTELEDLSFRYRNPAEYEDIHRKSCRSREQLNNQISSFALPIMERLTRNGIQYSVEGRPKSIFSIWKKMQRKHIAFEEIYDLLAMRIIFTPIPDIPEKTQCWFIYTLITEIYPVQIERTRDWVTTPKVNGYEALHCTLLGRHGDWVEVQIRTVRMNEVAERGVAAHWKYKGEDPTNVARMRTDIRQAYAAPHGGASDFLSNIRTNILTPQITVYDTDKKPYQLERGATVLDFAYAVSSTMGGRAIGAMVNGQLTNLDHALHGGDAVEILTAQSQHPTRKWLDYVRTAKAQNCISQSLADQYALLIDNGSLRVKSIFDELGITYSRPQLLRIIPSFHVDTLNEFYAGIAQGTINPYILRRRLSWLKHGRYFRYRMRMIQRSVHRHPAAEPVVDDTLAPLHVSPSTEQAGATVEYRQSPCCTALPGDEVVGYKRPDGVVSVHKVSCPEAVRLMAQQASSIVPVHWTTDPRHRYIAHFFISGGDRKGLLADTFSTLGDSLGLNITRVNMRSDGTAFRGVISLEVRDLNEINVALQRTNALRGIRRVYRLDNEQV